MRRIKRILATTAIAVVGVMGLNVAPALAHDVVTVSGTVNCEGTATISGTADVWGGVHIIVKVDGITVSDVADNGSNTDVKPFGPITVTGASAGQSIVAYTSDNYSGAESSTLGGPEGGCIRHTPGVTVTTECAVDQFNGDFHKVTYTFDLDGATGVTYGNGYPINTTEGGVLVLNSNVPNSAAGTSQTFTFTYEDGPEVVITKGITFSGTCPVVTPPPTCEELQNCPPPTCEELENCPVTPPPGCTHKCGPGVTPPPPPVKHPTSTTRKDTPKKELPFTGLPTGIIAGLGALLSGGGLLLRRRLG